MESALTLGELSRWLQGLESRIGQMHGENRGSMAKLETGLTEIARLQREANGRTGKLETAVAVADQRIQTVEQRQHTTEEEIDSIKGAATAAASQAIHDTAPSQKRTTALGAIAAGVTTGGILGLYLVGKMLFDAVMK
jgi:predicted  nucleic acid-binding Zn-ribbon protein